MIDLYRVTRRTVYGLNNDIDISFALVASAIPPVDQPPIRQIEVICADVPSLSYDTYEFKRKITKKEHRLLEELEILE
jgi:hypothetical protein